MRYNLRNNNACVVEGEAYAVPVAPPFLTNVAAAPGAGPAVNEFIFTATSVQSLIRIQRGVDMAGPPPTAVPFDVSYVTVEEILDIAPDLLMHTDYYAFGQQMPGRTWTASD